MSGALRIRGDGRESAQPGIGAVLERARRRLAAAGVPSPEVDAELLVAHVTGLRRGGLALARDKALPAAAGHRLQELLERRVAREPLQLLLGRVAFRRLELAVRPGVFIPRPETEVLAGEAIACLPPGGVAVEPCTGTGAVACALADEAEPAQVIAVDHAAAAAALARENVAACGLTGVQVLAGDLLDPLPAELRGRVDVLVANPPYLAADELDGLEPEVRDWDPRPALVAGPTGHEVADRLIAAASQWLRAQGWLLLEVDERRAAATAERCRSAGLEAVAVLADLAGRERIVRARRPAAGPGAARG